MKPKQEDGVTLASKPIDDQCKVLCYLLCARDDKDFVKGHGKCKAFHKRGNSSCRLHICQHYVLYKEKCEKAKVPINHWAIPQEIWRVMEESEGGRKARDANEEGQVATVG